MIDNFVMMNDGVDDIKSDDMMTLYPTSLISYRAAGRMLQGSMVDISAPTLHKDLLRFGMDV